MNQKEMQAALDVYFGVEGREIGGILREYDEGDNVWLVALCEDQNGEIDYLKAFERGMQSHIEQTQVGGGKKELGLALASSSVRLGAKLSYRRAMKKYSNSIVFEDVGINLVLVEDGGGVEIVTPMNANHYLRKLP